jgi:hypothetical protein
MRKFTCFVKLDFTSYPAAFKAVVASALVLKLFNRPLIHTAPLLATGEVPEKFQE